MARRTVLSADLCERHINMMAFTACIGFGLFLQSGIVIYLAGPGLAAIAFLLGCSVMWAIVGCLGEMTALLTVPGALFEFPGRFLDESVGYATAWTSWFSWIVSMASEIMTVSQLWSFNFQDDYLQKVGYPETGVGWPTGDDSPAVWVFIFLIIIGVANLLPVRLYGELEYFLGVLKITFIIGLIVINMMISALQLVPHGDHFWTWNKPYSFARNGFVLYVDSNNQPTSVLTGDAGRFVALWTAITTVMFSLIGFETIALTGPENRDLEKYEAIKIASKKLTFRLTILYTLATFTVGLNVPYDDPYLAQAAWSSIHGGQNSAFVLACILNHIRGFPGFFNAVFIFSATTSGMNCLYNASRILHALASIPEAWPLWAHGWRKRLERSTTSRGVPMAKVTVSWLFGLLAFLAVTSDASQALGRMSRNATVSSMLVYSVVCASYIRFFHRIKAASEDPTIENRSAFNRDDEQYPYRTHGQLFRAYYGLIFCVLLILFNGWRSFLVPFQTKDFIVSYIGIVAFIILVMLYHIKSDGLNPLRWRLSASMEIQRPPPKVVVAARRRGVLHLPDQKQLFTEENAKAIIDWVWVWVK
ncbi:Amino acid permease/ SLC12A domain containing protein [Elaphomyces granulatus]